MVKLSKSTYYYNLNVEGKEKAKPRGYSIDQEEKKVCDEQIKEFLCHQLLEMQLTTAIEKYLKDINSQLTIEGCTVLNTKRPKSY
ncbi:hypothetical protein [Clostridium sp.]|uniref:hypothetical protein n=1 Tax=Clostridium sp. TaxID=1506 RepID=UPI0039F5967D